MTSRTAFAATLGLLLAMPPLTSAQFLRIRASVAGDSAKLQLIVDLFRSGRNVTITAQQITDTLRARLINAGYQVGTTEEQWGPVDGSHAHLGIDLWAEGGIREDLDIICVTRVSRPGQAPRPFKYTLSRGGGRAALDLAHLGDWVAHHIPQPTSLGPTACRPPESEHADTSSILHLF